MQTQEYTFTTFCYKYGANGDRIYYEYSKLQQAYKRISIKRIESVMKLADVKEMDIARVARIKLLLTKSQLECKRKKLAHELYIIETELNMLTGNFDKLIQDEIDLNLRNSKVKKRANTNDCDEHPSQSLPNDLPPSQPLSPSQPQPLPDDLLFGEPIPDDFPQQNDAIPEEYPPAFIKKEYVERSHALPNNSSQPQSRPMPKKI